jgi:hypothetical protein
VDTAVNKIQVHGKAMFRQSMKFGICGIYNFIEHLESTLSLLIRFRQ